MFGSQFGGGSGRGVEAYGSIRSLSTAKNHISINACSATEYASDSVLGSGKAVAVKAAATSIGDAVNGMSLKQNGNAVVGHEI
jgi:hypothetical protein